MVSSISIQSLWSPVNYSHFTIKTITVAKGTRNTNIPTNIIAAIIDKFEIEHTTQLYKRRVIICVVPIHKGGWNFIKEIRLQR
ncbi:Hypothetical predicted protein [Octopus vulgaris]|uniref:Uncharacterized protein n=1 Tax=Octopus vulgaris TaxID=6645 RepID=A0AA36F267_OCTVU|nr:Hypothetical predicted protein [Octopus vulgaris]